MVRFLGGSSRAYHSELVGRIMRGIARPLHADPELWQCVGLLHDIDYPNTLLTREKHGVVAAEELKEHLPAEAVRAIAAHDRRAGIDCETQLCIALRGSDALAMIAYDSPEEELMKLAGDPGEGRDDVLTVCGGRAYLADLVLALCVEAGLSVGKLFTAVIDAVRSDRNNRETR